MRVKKSEFLVIGSGLGGLVCALKLSKIGGVNLVTKGRLEASNSVYAQGGIAAVTDEKDRFSRHIRDTMKAGAWLSDPETVKFAVSSGPEVIKELTDYGVKFDRKKDGFELGLEGGHSFRRILHRSDYTGREIVTALIKKVLQSPNIKVFENYYAVDVILRHHPKYTRPGKNRAIGAYVYDSSRNGIYSFISAKTILATGGAGKVYLYTSNPDIATGDGMAMGYKCGLDLMNMEFVQFHPTCLYHPRAGNFLISEALRGEGARLMLASGKKFMNKYSRLAELAPRDIVARAIDKELKKTGDEFVCLDISFRDPSFVKKRFPYIHKTCLDYGIDITRSPIPVVPAAHFFCGGLEVDRFSRTAIKNLYAVGETSFTGLHGANRLASNSLLEAAAFAAGACNSIKEDRIEIPERIPRYFLWDYRKTKNSGEDVIITQNWNEIRQLMWNYAGIIRTDDRLQKAGKRIGIITEEIEDYYNKYRPNRNFVELRNIAVVAKAIIKSSLKRKESRGLNFNEDYPFTLKKAVNTRFNRYERKIFRK